MPGLSALCAVNGRPHIRLCAVFGRYHDARHLRPEVFAAAEEKFVSAEATVDPTVVHVPVESPVFRLVLARCVGSANWILPQLVEDERPLPAVLALAGDDFPVPVADWRDILVLAFRLLGSSSGKLDKISAMGATSVPGTRTHCGSSGVSLGFAASSVVAATAIVSFSMSHSFRVGVDEVVGGYAIQLITECLIWG